MTSPPPTIAFAALDAFPVAEDHGVLRVGEAEAEASPLDLVADAAPAERPDRDWEDLVAALADDPYSFDFLQLVRLLDQANRGRLPPTGTAARAADERVRFCQDPSLAFAPSNVRSFRPAEGDAPNRLMVAFMGLLGPNGAMPLHLTEYARDRERAHDPAMARFLDLFNHRMIALFYRAWATCHQAVSFERGGGDRFAAYVASLIGMGQPSLRNRDAVPDRARLFFSGRLANQTRHAEGLRAIIQAYFGVEAEIEEFVGQWVDVPPDSRCRLGESPFTGTLGQTAVVGARMWDVQQKFRVRLGPMGLADYERLLPDGQSIKRLTAWIRTYAGLEFDWDVRLVLKAREIPKVQLGIGGRLGWTTWLGDRAAKGDGEDLVLRPTA